MTVTKTSGSLWTDGWTWNRMIWTKHQDRIPCYEIHWDGDGNATLTGRYALLTNQSILASQGVAKTPAPYEPRGDEELVTGDEASEVMRQINMGIS